MEMFLGGRTPLKIKTILGGEGGTPKKIRKTESVLTKMLPRPLPEVSIGPFDFKFNFQCNGDGIRVDL